MHGCNFQNMGNIINISSSNEEVYGLCINWDNEKFKKITVPLTEEGNYLVQFRNEWNTFDIPMGNYTILTVSKFSVTQYDTPSGNLFCILMSLHNIIYNK